MTNHWKLLLSRIRKDVPDVKRMNSQAIEKFIHAKQLEKEALMMMVPERYRKHLNVISREVTAMLIEIIEDINERCEEHLDEYDKAEESSEGMKDSESDREDERNSDSQRVRKVDIG